MTREEFVKQIKACGQSVIDNAEKIYNSFEYPTCGVRITIDIDNRSIPEIEVNKKFLPEGFMKRIGIK